MPPQNQTSWDKEDFMLHIRTKICGVEKDNQVIYQIFFDEDGKEVAKCKDVRRTHRILLFLFINRTAGILKIAISIR